MSSGNFIQLAQNITQLDPQPDSGPRDIITDSALFYIEMYVGGVATCLLSVFGVFSNIVNFIVFHKQNSNDCVTICLRFLALSDFCNMIATSTASFCAFIKSINPGLTIDPLALLFLMQWGSALCFDTSMATTAFISVERCLCVVMPFHFKNVFTSRVALLSIFIIYVFSIGSYMPIILSQGLWSQWDPAYNKTRVMLWLAENKDEVDKYSNIFIHIVAATIFQIVVVISTQVMILGLQRSVKFRKRMTTATTTNERSSSGQTSAFTIESNSAASPANNSNVADTPKQDVMSAKTKSVSKMVSILATIFIVCNFFRLAVIYARRIYPQLSPLNYMRNSYFAMLAVWKLIGAFCSSVNCFVYYAHSVSYRSIFLRTFCGGGRRSSTEN